jgi:hypothetical protein
VTKLSFLNSQISSRNVEYSVFRRHKERCKSPNTNATTKTEKNIRGSRLPDFISCSNLSFLNGCTIGDITGEFTCLQYNGSSVVDYMATSHNLKQQVRKFEVLPFTILSDHRPLLCSIDMDSEPLIRAEYISHKYQDFPKKPKWNPLTSPIVFKLEATMNPAVTVDIQAALDLE